MIRITKIIVACCLLMVATPLMVEAQNRGYKNSNRYGNAAESKIKAGIQVETGLLLTFGGGVFGEYKFTDAVGVQIAITGGNDYYYLGTIQGNHSTDALIRFSRILVPVVCRFYPGQDRQFCLFGGVQIGGVMNATATFTQNLFDKNGIPNTEEIKKILTSSSAGKDVDEMQNRYQVNKLVFGILLGLDYETNYGLMFGCSFSPGAFVTVFDAKHSFFTFTLRPTLGYNFAKLFE